MEALAYTKQNIRDQQKAACRAQNDGKERGQRSLGDLRFQAKPEDQKQNRKKNDLRRTADGGDDRLHHPAEKAVEAEHDAERDADQAAPQEAEPRLEKSDAEIAIEPFI